MSLTLTEESWKVIENRYIYDLERDYKSAVKKVNNPMESELQAILLAIHHLRYQG